MLTVDSKELYNENTADLVRGVFDYENIVSGPDVHAKVYHQGALENKANWDYEYTTKKHIDAHLGGVFGTMLDKDGLRADDLTVQDVRDIADRFWVDGKRYDIRGDMISDANYKNVISEIAMRVSMSFSGNPKGQSVGFLDKDKMPFEFKLDAFLPKEPEEVSVPKKPGVFKRIMNKVFGAFEDDFKAYEKGMEERVAYEQKLAAYEERLNGVNYRSGKNLEATLEFHAENVNSLYSKERVSFAEMTGSVEKTTEAVKDEIAKEKVSEL